MRILITLLLVAASLRADQSLNMNSSRSITLSGSPWNSMGNIRIEMRIHNIANCTTGDTGNSDIVLIRSIFGLGCRAVGSTTWHYTHASGSVLLGTMPLNGDVIIVSMRGPAVGKQIVDVWDATTGVRIIRVEGTSNATNVVNATAGTTGLPRGGSNVGKLAWVRAYSDVSSYDGKAMPDDYNAPAGDLMDFRYEGNVSGTVLGKTASLTPSPGAGEFSTTPNHPPVVYATALMSAGTVSTLTAKAVTFGQALAVSFMWQQIGGPSKLSFDSLRGAEVKVQGVVEGDYTLRLSAESAAGVVTKDIVVRAENRDHDGVPVFPSLDTTPYPLKLGLNDVPGATKVRATVLKPDGREMPPVVCASSPCDVNVDPKQKDHNIKLEYLSPDGRTLRTGSYAPVRAKQSRVPVQYGVYNRMGIMNYTAYPVNQGSYLEQLLRFQGPRYDVQFGGASLAPYMPDSEGISVAYIDLVAIYLNNIYKLKEVAAARGYKYEDMLLHFDADYDFTGVSDRAKYVWLTASRFDAGESWNDSQSVQGGVAAANSQSTQGVFTWTASGFVDRTTASYNATAGDVSIAHTAYFGYMEPFDEINYTLSVTQEGGTARHEYWNGSAWVTLPTRSDTTNGLTQSGKVLFNPPTAWRETQVNGSKSKWWIRVVVTEASRTPVASTILGDNWYAPGYSGTNWRWRGWAASSPTRIAGPAGYEYDPTPPAGASARFRYQSRALGLWAADHFFGNPANFQNNERTWARLVVDMIYPTVVAGKYSGILFDDGMAAPNHTVNPTNWQSHLEVAGRNYTQDLIDLYADARAYFRTLRPGGKTCVNSDEWNQTKQGDCFLMELVDESHKGGACSYPAGCGPKYDRLLPGPGNPNNTRGLFSIWDTRGDDFEWTGWLAWDRANRSPMTALASYYIIANPNTRFVYNVTGWTYGLTDEYKYVDEAATATLTTALNTDTTGSSKTLTGDFSAFPAGASYIRIGTLGEYLTVTKVNASQATTTERVYNSYPVGTEIRIVKVARLGKDPVPPLQQMVSWSNWFPGVGIDIGVPDPQGHNGGTRDFNWKTAAASGTKNGIQRRDFTRAIVLHASGYSTNANDLTKLGTALELGGTYYQLMANGRTGEGMTSIRLRTGEGVVLMKQPVR